MFLGAYNPKLDEKGRFFMPAKYRPDLSDGLVITRTQEHALAVYPMETFMQITQEIAKLPVTSKAVRDRQRIWATSSHDTTMDKQGRVMVPALLREYAQLDKDIAVIGAANRIEIWDAERWEKYSAAQVEEYAELDDPFPHPNG